MRHRIKLNIKERINRWLELCDFSYYLMKKALSPSRFKKRFERLREEHLQKDYKILQGWARIK